MNTNKTEKLTNSVTFLLSMNLIFHWTSTDIKKTTMQNTLLHKSPWNQTQPNLSVQTPKKLDTLSTFLGLLKTAHMLRYFCLAQRSRNIKKRKKTETTLHPLSHGASKTYLASSLFPASGQQCLSHFAAVSRPSNSVLCLFWMGLCRK